MKTSARILEESDPRNVYSMAAMLLEFVPPIPDLFLNFDATTIGTDFLTLIIYLSIYQCIFLLGVSESADDEFVVIHADEDPDRLKILIESYILFVEYSRSVWRYLVGVTKI